jgi:hypothetical protein
MRRFAMLVPVLLVTLTAFGATDTIRKGFNVAEGGTLRLDARIGAITVVTGGNGVGVEIVRTAHGRAGEERMKEHRIAFNQSGNDVTIESDLEHHWAFFDFDDYDVQWNIRVPSHYNLDVRTSGGSISLADIGGTVEAKTSGGSIKTGRLSGESALHTSGGSITVASATAHVDAHTSGGSITIGDTTGAIEAKTSGGSIHLGRVGGKVLARTSGGGIRVDDVTGSIDASTSGGSITATLSGQPEGDSRLSTSGGGVTVAIRSGINVELDAHASGGGVTTDVPVTVQGTQDDDTVRGRIGNGGPKLVLRSSGGGIRVKGA